MKVIYFFLSTLFLLSSCETPKEKKAHEAIESYQNFLLTNSAEEADTIFLTFKKGMTKDEFLNNKEKLRGDKLFISGEFVFNNNPNLHFNFFSVNGEYHNDSLHSVYLISNSYHDEISKIYKAKYGEPYKTSFSENWVKNGIHISIQKSETSCRIKYAILKKELELDSLIEQNLVNVLYDDLSVRNTATREYLKIKEQERARDEEERINATVKSTSF